MLCRLKDSNVNTISQVGAGEPSPAGTYLARFVLLQKMPETPETPSSRHLASYTSLPSLKSPSCTNAGARPPLSDWAAGAVQLTTACYGRQSCRRHPAFSRWDSMGSHGKNYVPNSAATQQSRAPGGRSRSPAVDGRVVFVTHMVVPFYMAGI